MTLSIPSEKMRKIQQDARKLLAQTSVSVRKIAQFCREGYSYNTSIAASPSLLLNTAVSDELSLPSGLHTEGDECKIQHYSSAGSNEQSRSILVAIPRQKVILSNPIAPSVPSVTIESDVSNKGMGAVRNGQTQTGQRRMGATTSTTWSCWQHF